MKLVNYNYYMWLQTSNQNDPYTIYRKRKRNNAKKQIAIARGIQQFNYFFLSLFLPIIITIPLLMIQAPISCGHTLSLSLLCFSSIFLCFTSNTNLHIKTLHLFHNFQYCFTLSRYFTLFSHVGFCHFVIFMLFSLFFIVCFNQSCFIYFNQYFYIEM